MGLSNLGRSRRGADHPSRLSDELCCAEPGRRGGRHWTSRQHWPAPLPATTLEGPEAACTGLPWRPPFWMVPKPPDQSALASQGKGSGKATSSWATPVQMSPKMLISVHVLNKNIRLLQK